MLHNLTVMLEDPVLSYFRTEPFRVKYSRDLIPRTAVVSKKP